eukprot:1445143-Ditylum_brightwellii.AAC.1
MQRTRHAALEMLKESFWSKRMFVGTTVTIIHKYFDIKKISPILHKLATWAVAGLLSWMAKYREFKP